MQLDGLYQRKNNNNSNLWLKVGQKEVKAIDGTKKFVNAIHTKPHTIHHLSFILLLTQERTRWEGTHLSIYNIGNLEGPLAFLHAPIHTHTHAHTHTHTHTCISTKYMMHYNYKCKPIHTLRYVCYIVYVHISAFGEHACFIIHRYINFELCVVALGYKFNMPCERPSSELLVYMYTLVCVYYTIHPKRRCAIPSSWLT